MNRNREQVLDLLRDDQEYYYGIGREYLSNSDVGTLLENPEDFKKPREDNAAFAVGRYFHQLILEPEKAAQVTYVKCKNRNTNMYREYLQEHGVSVALLQSEYEAANKWKDAMLNNMDFYECIRYPETQYEVPGIKEIGGAWWKGKADIVGHKFLFDLKTTAAIDRFKYSVYKYNYDSQAWIYQQIFGKSLVFLVIDKKNLTLGMYPVSHTSLLKGESKVMSALEVYHRYYGEGASDRIDQHYYYDEV